MVISKIYYQIYANIQVSSWWQTTGIDMSPVLTKIMVSNALMGSLNGDLLHILFIFEEAATVIEPDWASTPELI